MKTFHFLKTMAVVLLLGAGMTSCLKTSEPNFEVAPVVAYILQEGTGENARFTPHIYLFGNKPIAHTMMSPRCKFEEKNYYFEEVSGSAGYYLEMTSSMNSPVDTVKAWTFKIEAESKVVSETEESEYAVFSNTFTSAKSLGAFTADELEYKDDKVTATWDKVENAECYILMYRRSASNMWLEYPNGRFYPSEKEGRLTGTLSVQLLKDERFQIAIAAVNKSLLMVTSEKFVTGTYGSAAK